jgi:coenzyme F420-reducing hydrogenase gamma subunit
MEILRLEDEFPSILEVVDIAYFMMVKRQYSSGPYDVSFVEGSVSTPREIEEIKKVRANSKIVVALGDCAIYGCVPSIKNWFPEKIVEERVYENASEILSIKIRGIDEYVHVDLYLGGCPPHRTMFMETVRALLTNIGPNLRRHAVCMECKFRENECLLTSRKRPCMGPVTLAGCGAVCPSFNRDCEGCYGPMSDANATSLAEEFKAIGLSGDEILRKFRKYAGTSPKYAKEAGTQ